MRILLATHNKNKSREAEQILREEGLDAEVLTLDDITDLDASEDIVEDADTFEGNALIKVRYLYAKLGLPCLADDSGLEVDALGGEPGVRSARYADDEDNSLSRAQRNNNKLLRKLQGKTNRTARLRCAVAYIDAKGNEQTFCGSVEGVILEKAQGEGGFGYDPLFAPNEITDGRTFAELTPAEKNAISHRGRALRAWADTLQYDRDATIETRR